MMRIYVDADACPVKSEVARFAARCNLQVFMVSNQGMRKHLGAHIQGILVGPEFDAADNWIVEHVASGDLVITADIQLAARCLSKQAHVVGHTGHIFTVENIGSALATRELNAYLRESGELAAGQAPFSERSRSQFLQALDRIIGANRKA